MHKSCLCSLAGTQVMRGIGGTWARRALGPQGKGQENTTEVVSEKGPSWCCQGDCPACLPLLSVAVPPPQFPEQPLEQGAVGAAVVVGSQAVGGHANLFIHFPGCSQAARRDWSGKMKYSQRPLQEWLGPCLQDFLLASCSGQNIDLNS